MGAPRPNILHETMEPDRRNPDDPVEAEEYGALLLREWGRDRGQTSIARAEA